MLFISDAAKCRLCSQLSSAFRGLLWFAGRWCCAWINQKTNPEDYVGRVRDINSCAPACACEKHRMSRFSPGVVAGSERLSRFIFHPMHLDRRGNVKSNFFGYVTNNGCSVQRESLAANAEMSMFVSEFMNKNPKAVWSGIVEAICENVRIVQADDDLPQGTCVYDTAYEHNSSHAEICASRTLQEDGDANELRHDLWELFGAGHLGLPESYRDGAVWRNLSADLRDRRISK